MGYPWPDQYMVPPGVHVRVEPRPGHDIVELHGEMGGHRAREQVNIRTIRNSRHMQAIVEAFGHRIHNEVMSKTAPPQRAFQDMLDEVGRRLGLHPDDPILQGSRGRELTATEIKLRQEHIYQTMKQHMANKAAPSVIDQSVLGKIRAMQARSSFAADCVYLGEATYQRMLEELTPTNEKHQEIVLMKRVLGLHVNVLKDVAEHIGLGIGSEK